MHSWHKCLLLRWKEVGKLTQHKVKEWSFKEESIDCYICARAFILKTSREYKSKVLRGVCCCQRMVVGTLTTSSTGLTRAAPILFIFGWHSFQPFFHKPWLTESSGACQQSHTMKECLFILVLLWWHSSPPLLSQAMANRILRVPSNNHIPWRSVYFC